MDFAKEIKDRKDIEMEGTTGDHWNNKLTLPEIPDFVPKDHSATNIGLEKVKCITKPIIRNGEIVRDA